MKHERHGLSKTPTGISWRSMIERCYSKTATSYHNYGALGIFVCDFLRASPVNLVILIGLRPDGTTLDRTDNNGSYTCGQCAHCFENGYKFNIRWADRITQNRNQKDLRYIEIKGEKRCLSEWAELNGVKRSTVNARFMRGEPESTLFRKPKEQTVVCINGETKTLMEWAKIIGIDQSSLRKRIRKGWSDERLLSPSSQ